MGGMFTGPARMRMTGRRARRAFAKTVLQSGGPAPPWKARSSPSATVTRGAVVMAEDADTIASIGACRQRPPPKCGVTRRRRGMACASVAWQQHHFVTGVRWTGLRKRQKKLQQSVPQPRAWLPRPTAGSTRKDLVVAVRPAPPRPSTSRPGAPPSTVSADTETRWAQMVNGS